MKKLVCVFAHPDDEAFGPGGTIAKYTKEYEIYVICATKGEAGKNSIEEKLALGEIRAEELKQSADILGVKDIYFLGYEDGTLCNNVYHAIADKIIHILDKLQPEVLLTFNPNGGSGHLDHVAISYITTYVFHKLPYVQKLLYFTTDLEFSKRMTDYFIYWPKGYARDEVDLVVDYSDVWETKLAAMHKHTSQAHDIERILERKKDLPKEDYFLVINK